MKEQPLSNNIILWDCVYIVCIFFFVGQENPGYKEDSNEIEVS